MSVCWSDCTLPATSSYSHKTSSSLKWPKEIYLVGLLAEEIMIRKIGVYPLLDQSLARQVGLGHWVRLSLFHIFDATETERSARLIANLQQICI